MTAVSVVILTKNEALFIERCLHSVAWADDIVVLDSGSVDDTRQLAEKLGARVAVQEWLGFSQQHNAAIALAKYDWVFCIDSDEIVTPELANSIVKVMSSNPDPQDGYAVDRRGDFLGVLLANPSRPSKLKGFVRLFNRQFGAYDPSMRVHEVVKVPGKSHVLDGVLLHWRGYVLDEYVPVFNNYATVEAEILNEKGMRATSSAIFGRPILRFVWAYFWKKGYKRGTRGLIHAMLKAFSEYIRYAKLWEMQNTTKTIDPPPALYTPTEK